MIYQDESNLIEAIKKYIKDYCEQFKDDPNLLPGRFKLTIEPNKRDLLTEITLIEQIEDIFNRYIAAGGILFQVLDTRLNKVIMIFCYEKRKLAWKLDLQNWIPKED